MRTETKTNYILIVLLYLFALSTVLYSFEAIQSVVMLLSSVFMILQFRSGKPFFTTKTAPFLLSFIIICSIGLWYFSAKSVQLIANNLLLFVVPLFSIYLYQSKRFLENKKNILLTYCFAVGLLCVYIVGYYIKDIPNHQFNWYFARFNIENHLHFHGTYLSLWMGVAVLFVMDFLVKRDESKTYLNYSVAVLMVLLIAGLIIINSRMILYSVLFLSVLNYYFYYYKTNLGSKKKTFLYLIALVCLILFLSQRYIADIEFLYKNAVSNSSRYTICYCSLQTIFDSFFLGMDPSIIQNKLNTCYDNYGFYELSKENINSHNQYLDYFLKGGILLFISFIFTLIVKLRHSLKQKNYLYFSITVLFSFAFITENILVRQYGMFIYVFCDVLLLGAILSDESHNADKIEER